MSQPATLKAILRTTEKYEAFLDGLTEEQFIQTPAEGVWSYAEVVSHIFQANIASLIAIERCIHGNKSTSGKPTFAARLILFFGLFPPVKLKAPAQIAEMAVKSSREDARNYIVKFKDKLAEIAPQIAKANSQNSIKHPRLGMLNAKQWLRFIEIHTNHHYKQLGRIRKMLSKVFRHAEVLEA